MNLIPTIGPFDFKVFGPQKAFIKRSVEFVVRNENAQVQEIFILNPNGSFKSFTNFDKLGDGEISMVFIPEEIGLHEIRIFSNNMNRSSYNSFEFNVFDSSKLTIEFDEEAIVGKFYKFIVDCKNAGEGTLNVQIEQQDRKLRPFVKHLKSENSTDLNYTYEISFMPETESKCRIDLEYLDISDNIINGDSFLIDVVARYFKITPFPLQPFSINTKSSFNIEFLESINTSNIQFMIKPTNKEIDAQKEIEFEVTHLEGNSYQISFTPKLIERHFFEIYADDLLLNSDRSIKIDIYDVSKIKAKMPSTIMFGELNTFVVDTTGAGEGNLEVIIKDGYDTLNAQLLKREKRKFEIGFFCERNMKHDIQVIFNGQQIKDSPFYILPESLALNGSIEMLADVGTVDDFMIIEGGPLDGLQCGEKMWIIFDAKSPPYYDVQFLVIDDCNYPIKHTKIQQEDGRWRIEFIPHNVGMYQIQRILQDENSNRAKIQLLQKVNVLSYNAQRVVYGYKLNNIEDSVQLVFDAANYRVQDISIQVKDPNDENVKDLECKYLSDYMALKFQPMTTGGYLINFIDRKNSQQLAASPYKVIVHEDFKEIITSSGIYDLTRLTIAYKNLPANYNLNQFKIDVFDPQDKPIQNCFFSNKKRDLIIEFITRIEGIHKIFFYINNELVDDNPFLIYVNGDTYTANSLYGIFSSYPTKSSNGFSPRGLWNSSSSGSQNEFPGTFSPPSIYSNSNSDSQINNLNGPICQAAIGHGTILCCKKNIEFHFVINNRNIQGLCVNDSLNNPVPFKLGEDDHENGSIIILPKLEGTHRIMGLIEGRDFEAQLYVIDEPSYLSLFDMDNYAADNFIEKPFVITLKESNLEVDAYDPLGERVDVRYTGDNLATFIPRTSGYFKVYISDYHGPVLGSPFFVLIHQYPSHIETNSVESSGIRDTIRNEESKFIIRNKDLEIDVQIKNKDNQPLVLRKKRTQQGYLQVCYTPELIGTHQIDIFKSGVKVSPDPILIHVSDPNLVKVENLLRESKVDQIFSFNIDASNAGEGFIRVNIRDSKMDDILPDITEFDDRKYIVRFIPKIAGLYELSLTFNKYHVIESPFKVLINELSESVRSFEKQTSIQSTSGSFQNNSVANLINQEDAGNETVHLISQKEFNDLPSLEYELSNWNNQLNNSLNKIMEVTNNKPTKRALTPITDTSEEESQETMPIYRGETFIENVERLPDGSSHLLLRIEDDSDLIDSKNLNKARGKYKYRFKRIGLLNDTSAPQTNTSLNKNQKEEAQNQKNENNKKEAEQQICVDSTTESESDLSERSKEIVQIALGNALETIKLAKDKDKKLKKIDEISSLPQKSFTHDPSLSSTVSFPLKKETDESNKLPSFNEKRKLFENSSASPPKAIITQLEQDTSAPKSNKVLDLIKQLNQSTSKSPSPLKQVQSPENNNSMSKCNKKEFKQEQSKNEKLSENNDDEDDEYNVANENMVTKLTKAKQKKINQEKTVVIEENYVITPRDSNIIPIEKQIQEHSSNTETDNLTKMTTEKSHNGKPTKLEELTVKKEHVSGIPQLIKHEASHVSKLVSNSNRKELIEEKFKPEETIQYEYQQLIEQPDKNFDQKEQRMPDSSNFDKDKIKTKLENTTKKTTKQKTREKFEHIENVHQDQIKKITTDRTTYIKEEVEDHCMEILEKTTNTQEFSYQHLKNRQNFDSATDLDTSNFVSLADQLNSTIEVDQISDEKTIAASITVSQENTTIRDPKKFQNNEDSSFTLNSNSNENILEYYKLQPAIKKSNNFNKSLDEDQEDELVEEEITVDYSNIILPVDLNTLHHGEELKPQESTTFDDTYVKSKSSTKGSLSPQLLDETDSYINDSVSFERETTFDQKKINRNSGEDTYFKPIETMTAEDFFNVPKNSTITDSNEKKSIDLIKAKFETGKDSFEHLENRKKFKNKNENKLNLSETDKESTLTSDSLSTGKFARVSKKNSDNGLNEKDKKKNASLVKQFPSEETLDITSSSSSNTLPSDDWSKPTIKSRIISKLPKETNNTEYEEDEELENNRMDRFKKFNYENENSDETQNKRRLSKKIRKPQVYPIDDHPMDDDCFILNKSTCSNKNNRKTLSTDFEENTINSSEKQPLKEEKDEPPVVVYDKNIKSIVNKYEVKQPIKNDSILQNNSTVCEQSNKRINKLPKNIVDMFNSNKKEPAVTEVVSSSSVLSKTVSKPGNDAKMQNQSTKNSPSDKTNIDNEKIDSANDDLLTQKKKRNLEENIVKEVTNNNDKIKKLSKSIIGQFQKKPESLELTPDNKLGEHQTHKSKQLDFSNNKTDSQFDEPKKLSKSTLQLYESSTDGLNPKRKFFEEKFRNSSIDSAKLNSPRNNLSFREKSPKDETQQVQSLREKGYPPNTTGNVKEINTDDSLETEGKPSFEEETNDKGVKRLVGKWEKKPVKKDEQWEVNDQNEQKSPFFSKNIKNQNNTEIPHVAKIEQTKTNNVKHLISSLIDDQTKQGDSKNGEKKHNEFKSKEQNIVNQLHHHGSQDEKGIKKLINIYQPDSQNNYGNIKKNDSNQNNLKIGQISKKDVSLMHNEEKANDFVNTMSEDSSSPNDSLESSNVKDKGVKGLVNKYENKQNMPHLDDSISSVSFYSHQDISKPISKLVEQNEMYGIYNDSFQYLKTSETTSTTFPYSYYSTDHSTNKPKSANDNISTATNRTFHEKSTTLDDLKLNHLNEIKNSAIKKIIQQYEKNPFDQVLTSTSSFKTVEEEKEDSSLGTVSMLDEKYKERISPVSVNSEDNQIVMLTQDTAHVDFNKKVEDHSLSLVKKDQNSLVSNLSKAHIFKNNNSDLMAILYLTNQHDCSQFKVFLKVNSNEHLEFDIAKINHEKIPFKVKQKINHTTLSFTNDKVIDFNLAMRKLIESGSNLSVESEKLKAQLEIITDKKFEFKIIRQETNEEIPIRIEPRFNNVQKIFFELKTGSKFSYYTVKSNPTPLQIEAENLFSTKNLRKCSFQSEDSAYRSAERTISGRASSQACLTPSDFENFLEKTKNDIHKKLQNLKEAEINVQLEVEYKKPLGFSVTKSSNGQPIEFEPVLSKPNNRQTIFFNYDSIVDFSIGIKESTQTIAKEVFEDDSDETLRAEIEVSVSGEYEFQIVRKDTQEPIKIQVMPKKNNSYRIKFEPLSITSYTLKAFQKSAPIQSLNTNEVQFSEQEVKKKLKKSLINPILAKLPQDFINSNSGLENEIKINFSISNPSQDSNLKTPTMQDKTTKEICKEKASEFSTSSGYEMSSSSVENGSSGVKIPCLNCILYNPKNLEINEQLKTTNSVSFIVNTQNAGEGELRCFASYSDGNQNALVEQYQLDKYIYTIRIFAHKINTGLLNLYLEHD